MATYMAFCDFIILDGAHMFMYEKGLMLLLLLLLQIPIA